MPYSHPRSFDPHEVHRRVRHLLPSAAALAGTAGCIHSVVLGFFRTPVSHMTGAVSHLGLDLADGRMADGLASSSIILGFVLGAMVAGLLAGALKRVPSRSYGVVMLVEGTLLAVATGLLMVGHLLGLPTVAMACGLQNAMISSYCGLVIRTTHITGTITDIGVMLGHWIRHRQIDRGKLLFLTVVVLAFGGGGCLGALADLRFGPRCLSLAAAAMTIAGGLFWFLTHRGLVDLMQDAHPQPPRTSSFLGR